MALTTITPLGYTLGPCDHSSYDCNPLSGSLYTKHPTSCLQDSQKVELQNVEMSMPQLLVSFCDFRFFNAEMLRSLVLRNTEVPNSEMTTNTNYPCPTLFLSDFGFLCFGLSQGKVFSLVPAPLHFQHPKYRSTDMPSYSWLRSTTVI
jgi:hypothetical protein